MNYKFDNSNVIKIPKSLSNSEDYLYFEGLQGVYEVYENEEDFFIYPHILNSENLEFNNKYKTIEPSTFVSVSNIEVKLFNNPKGLKFEELRKQLKRQKFFINNQTFIFKSNKQEFIGTIISSSGQSNITIDELTFIKFQGDNVITLDKIAGNKKLKNWLKDEYLFCIENKKLIESWNLKVPTGLLLFGPPGNGKTLFAKALSAELGCAFFILDSAKAISSSAGDADKIIKVFFDEARKLSPSIIFIDEVEALCLTRKTSNQGFENRVATVLLTEMDGMNSNDGVLLIGATNKPEMIDVAFKRAGRFSYHIEVENPNDEDKIELLKIVSSNFKFENYDEIEKFITENTLNYSNADIENLIQRSALNAIRENKENPIVNINHLKKSYKDYGDRK